jgi:DNA-binding response OmpR family regulator
MLLSENDLELSKVQLDMRVLLVEDETDLGMAIKRTLKQHQYLVDWATDGNEAWEYLESNWTQYTLGIFDWILPGLTGIELCQRLRAKGNSLPILMLTARDRMEDKVAGLDAGADDYLVKPFGMAELLARLRALQRRFPNFQTKQVCFGNLTLDYANCAVINGNFSEFCQAVRVKASKLWVCVNCEIFVKIEKSRVTLLSITNGE